MSEQQTTAEFMTVARERYEFALQTEAEDRREGKEDVAFVAGDQWKPEAYKARKDKKRPIQTWNRLQTFVAQVVNAGRENKPAIQTAAMDGGKKETAEMLEGRIRHIEYESDADIAYDTAREHQVVSGRGAIRVKTEYIGKSFKQRIVIEPIENPWSVLFDPAARRYDRRDADWCFVSTEMSRDAYKRRFGVMTEAAKNDFFAGIENPAPDWIGTGANGQMVQVAEYWLKEYRKRTLCLLSDISVCYQDELPDNIPESHIVDRREEDCVTVVQYIIDGVEILDQTEWIGSYIPIVPVWGKQMVVEGRRRNYSLVRFAKDPQRLVNLYVSNIAEQIALMPKNPYMAAEGQILGREDEWEAINEEPRAVIQYKGRDINGDQVGAPQRQTNEPPIQALTIGLNQAIDAIKAAMGIFDSSLGEASNETSGVAIQRRRNESDVANFHFPDNESRSRKHVGRILLELIPIIDKNELEVPTRGQDGKASQVKLRQPITENGKTYEHHVDQGNYDAAISTGPSYLSQRQEASATYSEIAAKDPNFMVYAGDLLFRTMDSPGADAIADRYEKMLPAPLQPQDPDAAQKSQQQIGQMTQQLQALSQQLDQAHAFAQNLHSQIQNKQVEAQTKIEVAKMQEETKRVIALAQIDLKRGVTLLEGETQAISQKHEMIQAAASQHAAQEHERAMAEQGQMAAAQQQQGSQDHQRSMVEDGQAHAAQMQEAAAQQQAAQPQDQPTK